MRDFQIAARPLPQLKDRVDHQSRYHYATSMLNALLVLNLILFVGQPLPFCEDLILLYCNDRGWHETIVRTE